ncbi:MAG: hypothetical protein WCT20_04570, partial [Candidatus Babeliales bacterium]
MKQIITRVFFLSYIFYVPNGLAHSFINNLKCVHVKSYSQTLVDSNRARFDGQVEVLVDQKLHLWADHVTIDKKNQELVAWA